QDGAVTVLAGLFVVGEALGVDVDGMELGEAGLTVVEVVWGRRRADEHPAAVAGGLFGFAVGGGVDRPPRGPGLFGGGGGWRARAGSGKDTAATPATTAAPAITLVRLNRNMVLPPRFRKMGALETPVAEGIDHQFRPRALLLGPQVGLCDPRRLCPA